MQEEKKRTNEICIKSDLIVVVVVVFIDDKVCQQFLGTFHQSSTFPVFYLILLFSATYGAALTSLRTEICSG